MTHGLAVNRFSPHGNWTMFEDTSQDWPLSLFESGFDIQHFARDLLAQVCDHYLTPHVIYHTMRLNLATNSKLRTGKGSGLKYMQSVFQKHPSSADNITHFPIFRINSNVKAYFYSVHKVNKKTDRSTPSDFR